MRAGALSVLYFLGNADLSFVFSNDCNRSGYAAVCWMIPFSPPQRQHEHIESMFQGWSFRLVFQ